MGRGFRVAQQGYTIEDPDSRQAFSSSWPVLGILDSGPFLANAGRAIVQHNLGWKPAFMLFVDVVNNTKIKNTAALPDAFINKFFGVDEYTLTTSPAGGSGVAGHYYIFNLDLERQFQSETIDPGDLRDLNSQTTTDSRIRFAKDGITTESRRPRDYVLREDARSPMVHSVTPGKKGSGTTPIVVNHDLGYGPKVFVYADITGGSSAGRYALMTSASDTTVIVTDHDVRITVPYNCKYSIVILKNPISL